MSFILSDKIQYMTFMSAAGKVGEDEHCSARCCGSGSRIYSRSVTYEAVRVGRNQGEGRYVENGVGKRGRVWGADNTGRVPQVSSHVLPEFG